jgi:trehalose 6-phosphate synthase
MIDEAKSADEHSAMTDRLSRAVGPAEATGPHVPTSLPPYPTPPRRLAGLPLQPSGKAAPPRLVVVSNRVTDTRRDARAGGLAIAIAEALRDGGGLWFGWSGEVDPEANGTEPRLSSSDGIDLATIDLTPAELEGYYHGFANQCLWPILHYRADLVRFDRAFVATYMAVNRRFAEALAPQLRPDDIIWVHDFHLLPLGAELRRLGCLQPIGFFLHVPFPPPEVLAALPGHDDLFATLLAYDVVGFQTANDLGCFRSYMRRMPGAEFSPDGVLRGRRGDLTAAAFPIGIDVQSWAALSASEETRRQVAKVRQSFRDRTLIVGVDRLDYSKGLPERFAAYRQFLEDHAEMRSRTMLLQVSPPSRDTLDPYANIRRELDRLEGSIHGDFADMDWTPIRYVRRHLPRRRLAALYRASCVGLVTPLRDGMNLVAKEFVAAQDEDDPGVLILSCFAGAAEAMTEALVVNPHDVDEVAGALRRAIDMPLDERRARHARLLAAIREQDVHSWRRAFVDALAHSGGRSAKPLRRSAPDPRPYADGAPPPGRQAVPRLRTAERIDRATRLGRSWW